MNGPDKEINYEVLVAGHESFGRWRERARYRAWQSLAEPGDYVVATVRRPGISIYDRVGTYDMTTDKTYFERGIHLRHGYLTERYAEVPGDRVMLGNKVAVGSVNANRTYFELGLWTWRWPCILDGWRGS